MNDVVIRDLFIRGDKVSLRDWTNDDVDALHTWLTPPPDGGIHDWQRTNGPYYPPIDAAGADRYCTKLRQHIASGELPTPRESLAIIANDSGTLIGDVSWHFHEQTNRPDDVVVGAGTYALPWIRLGILIYPPQRWSGGYGTEALRLWVDYLFATTDVGRLDYATWSGNIGMCRVGEKLGFTLEARFRNARLVEGELYDSLVYGVLREEWDAPGN